MVPQDANRYLIRHVLSSAPMTQQQKASKNRSVTRGKMLRYRLETGLLLTVTWILPRLSRRMMLRCARALGAVAYRLMGRQRKIALANLDVAFGDTMTAAEKERIARRSMEQFASSLLGLFWSARMTVDDVDSVIEIDPRDLALARGMVEEGRGIIFVTLHYGDWEMLGLASGFLGVPLHVVTETMRNKGMEEVFARLRTRSGNAVIPQQGAAVKLLRALRRKGSIALLIDLNAPDHSGGMWMDFFGLPVYNNTAAAALALRTGARIVGACTIPLPDGRVRLKFGPEIPCESTGDDQADLRRVSKACLEYCEQVIREAPEFWLWSYKRWKHRPEKPRGHYPFYTTWKPMDDGKLATARTGTDRP
jgi:KDO2-lipid IV(A) lauroyltransferase